MIWIATLLRQLVPVFYAVVGALYTVALVEFLLYDGSRSLTLALWP